MTYTLHYSVHMTSDRLFLMIQVSKSEDETPTCEVEVLNLPIHQPPELVSIRLRHLAKKCGGRVVSVTAPTAILKFSTPDHASR